MIFHLFENAMKDCDKIIHAMVSFHKEDAELMNKINVEGTKNNNESYFNRNKESFLY